MTVLRPVLARIVARLERRGARSYVADIDPAVRALRRQRQASERATNDAWRQIDARAYGIRKTREDIAGTFGGPR